MAFADFPEQEQVVALLQRSLERGRLGHAYLFAGDSLSELEAVARTLAKTLNCQQPRHRGVDRRAIDCCDQCLSCRKIDQANHPDVQWVRPEMKSRQIGIDQIVGRPTTRGKPLLDIIYLKPTEAEYKVAVIIGADRMTREAANAFLKTLEEPPARSVLILLTTDRERILETILSRCLRLTFAGGTGRRVDPAQAAWLVQFVESAAGGQQSLLGRYRLLGVLLKWLATMKEALEKEFTARSPLEQYPDAEPELREKWEDELTAAIEAEYRRQRAELLVSLEFWLRDVWLHSLALNGDLLSLPQTASQTAVIASRISPEAAVENLDVLEQTQRLLYSNVQEALALEVGFLKLKL